MVEGRMGVVRRWMLVALILGLVGSVTELVLLEHYEDAWQIVPLALMGLTVIVLWWEIVRPTRASERLLRSMMALFIVAGVVGVVLHMRGAAEFQHEIDPEMPRWTLISKVLRAKAPPALAPGLMIQLGLLGLTYTFTKEKQS